MDKALNVGDAQESPGQPLQRRTVGKLAEALGVLGSEAEKVAFTIRQGDNTWFAKKKSQAGETTKGCDSMPVTLFGEHNQR